MQMKFYLVGNQPVLMLMKFVLVVGVLALTLAIQNSAASKFKLLHFNDFHSKVEPSNEYHRSCEKEQLQKGATAQPLACMLCNRVALKWCCSAACTREVILGFGPITLNPKTHNDYCAMSQECVLVD